MSETMTTILEVLSEPSMPSKQSVSQSTIPEAQSTPRSWTKVPELKGTRLSELMQELAEVQGEIDGLEATKERVRGLIGELVSPLTFGVRVRDRVATWTIPKPGRKLSEAKLARAGVTPDQMEAGYIVVPAKKPHLVVRVIEEQEEKDLTDEP